MTKTQIETIRRKVERSATDPMYADADVLVALAIEIVDIISDDYPGAEDILAPTTTERKVLGQVAHQLLTDGRHSRVTWRMRAAETALSTLSRITVFGTDEV